MAFFRPVRPYARPDQLGSVAAIVIRFSAHKRHFWPLWDTQRNGLLVLPKILELAWSPPEKHIKFVLLAPKNFQLQADFDPILLLASAHPPLRRSTAHVHYFPVLSAFFEEVKVLATRKKF